MIHRIRAQYAIRRQFGQLGRMRALFEAIKAALKAAPTSPAATPSPSTRCCKDALHLEIGRCGQTEQNRVARCLRSIGWERKQVRTGDKREWRYRRPVTSGDAEKDQTDNVTSFRVVTGDKR
jgi:hypothetical protein